MIRIPMIPIATLVLFLPFLPVFTIAEEPTLQKGDRLAIVGDSITEQKLYSKFIETYLLACYPGLGIQCFQFGWGGERAPGFANRMENDLVPWNPDVVTTCYGMNDGGYRPYEERIGQIYEAGMRQIVDRMQKAGATVVVGSPGVVDSFTWQRGNPDFDEVYNDNLEKLGEIAAEIAGEKGLPHADVFHVMEKAMISAKAAFGKEYPVAGGDGVHPGPNGHLVMAYAFLKALGLDGKIGSVTVDLASEKAETSDGHQVLGIKEGTVELESSRYPFCFAGNETDPNGTRSILPHIPFNEDLNRFTLTVKNLSTSQADITFGYETKTFSKEQLATGINLAAEFFNTPFVDPFYEVMNAVGQKQSFETAMIKGFITNFRHFGKSFEGDEEAQNAFDLLRQKMTEKNDEAYSKAKATVKPVRYSIVITPKA